MTFILKILPLQMEHICFFNLHMKNAKMRSRTKETANATLRQYTRRGVTLLSPT